MENDYYNLVVIVITRYEVTKTKIELTNSMEKKGNSSMYTKMVIKYLNLAATYHNLEDICQKVS